MSGDPVAFSNTSAVDICSCVYLITCQALHSPTFRPHALLNKLTYGFKNEKENLQVSDDDLRKILITCLNVFPDNGTIFQINKETAYDVSDNILFSDAVILNCGKAEIINKHVVLSGVNRNGKREEYTV